MTSSLPPRAMLAAPLAALVLYSILHVSVRASERDNSASDDALTVFVGLDLTLEHERTDCPVVDADRGTVEILQNENAIRVPMREGKFKTTFSPRVGRSRVEIAHLQTRRVDSHLEDQARDSRSQMVLMESIRGQQQEIAEIKARNAINDAALAEAQSARGIPVDVGAARRAAERAMNSFNDSFASPAFASALPGADLLPADDTGSGGLFDAFEASFELSSPVAIDDAYGVLRVVIRDPLNRNQPIPFIKIFKVHQLGTKPRRFTVLFEGLPTGFSVDGHAVHLFARGREFPTNLSKNRVDVNENEAHQFLILQYLQQHHQGSLPVAIIADLLPPGLRPLIDANQMNATVDLAIDREGHVTAIRESTIPSGLSPELEAALRRARFFPALLHGNPVDGRGTFALSEFVR